MLYIWSEEGLKARIEQLKSQGMARLDAINQAKRERDEGIEDITRKYRDLPEGEERDEIVAIYEDYLGTLTPEEGAGRISKKVTTVPGSSGSFDLSDLRDQLDRIEGLLQELVGRGTLRSGEREKDTGLFELLCKKRASLSKQHRTPAFTICQTELLTEIAQVQPRTLREMSSLKFRGSQFEKYGEIFLQTCLDYYEESAVG